MRRLSPDVNEGILRRLLEGVSYRTIAHEFGVSIASVNRVYEDARKMKPDLDSLRDLSVLLKKAGLSVFEATRACKLSESMNKLGISADELGEYISANERFLSEKALDKDFVFYAMKLMQLEQGYGRTYQEVVEDFEKKRIEASEAEEAKTALQEESQRLRAELEELETDLAEKKREIFEATTLWKGLAEIGPEKLSQLIRFVQDFHSMGFDAGLMEKLAVWHQELERLHIDPDELDKYITEKGPLEAQINNLRSIKERIGADVSAQTVRKATLVAHSSALQAVDCTLETGSLTMFCKSCRAPLPIALPTRESLMRWISSGQPPSYRCQNCGVIQPVTPWDIVFQIAFTILPAAF